MDRESGGLSNSCACSSVNVAFLPVNEIYISHHSMCFHSVCLRVLFMDGGMFSSVLHWTQSKVFSLSYVPLKFLHQFDFSVYCQWLVVSWWFGWCHFIDDCHSEQLEMATHASICFIIERKFDYYCTNDWLENVLQPNLCERERVCVCGFHCVDFTHSLRPTDIHAVCTRKLDFQ